MAIFTCNSVGNMRCPKSVGNMCGRYVLLWKPTTVEVRHGGERLSRNSAWRLTREGKMGSRRARRRKSIKRRLRRQPMFSGSLDFQRGFFHLHVLAVFFFALKLLFEEWIAVASFFKFIYTTAKKV